MTYQYPFRVENPGEPPPQLSVLRESEPVAPVVTAGGDRAWFVSGYDEVRALLADNRLRARFPGMQISAEDIEGLAESTDIMLMKEGADHTRLRGLVSRAFSARYIESLREGIESTAEEMVSNLLAGRTSADIVEDFAVPFVSTVNSDILDVQVEDRDEFNQCARTVMATASSEDYSFEDVTGAIMSLLVFISNLIKQRREKPGNDLISALIDIHDQKDGRLSDGELLGLGVTLMAAGFLPTVAALSHGVLLLLSEPGQYAKLRDNPAGLVNAVDEIVRYAAEGDPMRMTKEDLSIAGVTIREGDLVILSRSSANRDARCFAAPDSFQPDRVPNPHLAFGHGPHYCLGRPLATLQLETALGVLTRRVPQLRLACRAEDIEWSTGTFTAMPRAIPVSWQ